MASWRKMGLFIAPQPDHWWWQSHAMLPTVLDLGSGLFRLFFSGRDANNVSHIGTAVIDVTGEPKVVETGAEPVLSPGALGCFDDNGVSPSCAVRVGSRLHLYYIGWQPGSTVRVNLFGGLAISDDDGRSFTRWSRAPVLERIKTDPYLNTAPWVIPQNGGWRIYYVSGCGWDGPDNPRYHIKTAYSSDALHWDRNGDVCIDFAGPEEMRLARPCVVRDGNGLYRMWFAHAGPSYRLGYAESDDGVTWRRNDAKAGLTVSETGWDSEMVEYAAVFGYGHRHFMIYNGNGYGVEGAGIAVLDGPLQ